jgi:NTP-dependent ternary system trypsin peptidase co-occuring protein
MNHVPDAGIGLADAIEILRNEVLKAHLDAGKSTVTLPVESMTIELKAVATRSADGKAGFSVPFVNVELGGSVGWERESTNTVTVTFGTPVDRAGHPVAVAGESNELKG